MKFNSTLTRLCLCLLLALGAWLAASYLIRTWKASIMTSVTTTLDAAWRAKLTDAASDANQKLEKERNAYETGIRNVLAERERMRIQLQQRPSRASQQQPPTTTGGTPAATQACTGAGLAREDADFLAGYASDAAEQQEQLKQTTSMYETCRETLRKVTASGGVDKGDKNGNQGNSPQGLLP